MISSNTINGKFNTWTVTQKSHDTKDAQATYLTRENNRTGNKYTAASGTATQNGRTTDITGTYNHQSERTRVEVDYDGNYIDGQISSVNGPNASGFVAQASGENFNKVWADYTRSAG